MTAMLRRFGRLGCLFLVAGALIAAAPSRSPPAAGFVQTDGDSFTLNGAPFYVTGVNNHYMTYASDAEVSDVLDAAVAMGANVLRVFLLPVIGAPDGSVPTVWDWHSHTDASNLGVNGAYLLYWDPATKRMGINSGANGIQKVDFLIAQAAKRHLKLLITFVDFWGFLGGSQQMRAWYGSTKKDSSFFFTDPRTTADYKTWVKFIIERHNPRTGLAYRDDPTIFAWELMNEPQAPLHIRNPWLATMASYVKSLDPHHLVGSGEDRLNDADFVIPALDFVTWHGYPLYYGITPAKFDDLISKDCALGSRYAKPVLLEEFGYANTNRDPSQAQAYQSWLKTMARQPDCAGWLVWRLVAKQDSGQFPADVSDHFDVRDDGSPTWQVLSAAAHAGRHYGSDQASLVK